jgi:hypothetical protein
VDITSEQMTVVTASRGKRQRRSVEEKRRIVEETLKAGASVARVAQRYAVNANQVFSWRKKYREGRLGKASKLLPVTVSDIPSSESNRAGSGSLLSADGSMGWMPRPTPPGWSDPTPRRNERRSATDDREEGGHSISIPARAPVAQDQPCFARSVGSAFRPARCDRNPRKPVWGERTG